MMRHASLMATAILIVGFLTSCSLNPKPDPTRYYVITAMPDDPGLRSAAGVGGENAEPARGEAEAPLGQTIGVGPVSLPSYLGRTRMVTRVTDNELRFAETERWAEPLGDAFLSALGRDVGFLLQADEILLYPWYRTESPDYTVRIDVARFERDTSGAVSLVGQWEVRRGSGETVAGGVIEAREPVEAPTFKASAAAQSRLVASLARQIADAIRADS